MRTLRLHFVLCASVVAAMTSAAAISASSPTPVADADSVVASQGTAQITLGDVDTFANTIPSDDRGTLFASPERIESVLRNLLSQKQLLNESRELKLQDDPTVEAAMQQAANGVLVKARVNRLRDKFAREVPPMSELARERYLANPDDYVIPERIDVKHILIGTKDRTDSEAKTLADKLYVELEQNPDQFGEYVDKYSDDPSKSGNHGLVKNAASGNFVPAFKEAVSKLQKVGELSRPVKTRFGYHLIKVISMVPASPRSFAEVESDLVKKLQKDWVAKKVQDYLDDLRSRKIDANPDLVSSLRSRYEKSDKSEK